MEDLDYSTYKLRKKYQHYDRRIAQKVSEYQKRLKRQLKETEIDESDPVSILAFLKEFRDA